MANAASAVNDRARFAVRRDVRTVRKTLQRIRESDYLAHVRLFGRPASSRTLERIERCRRDRGSVRMPVYVTPATFDGRYAAPLEDHQDAILAITKDVSLRGVAFTHDEPVRGDCAIVTFDLLDEEPVSLLLEIRWSNAWKGGSRLSGGRFLAVVEAPDSDSARRLWR
jgi:hypothetical protein